MSEPVIEVRSLARTYHVGDIDIHALNGVSLSIARGEFVAIVGASGSGKSTLMAILGCLDRPTSGQYLFEGVDVSTLSEPELAHLRSARIGFVFQSFNLLPRTSAIENVALPLYYSASGPAGRKSRVDRARQMLGLVGLADRELNTPAQLSGGQQQRVAMARALINSPSLLCADEPTGNLDSKTSYEVMNTLASLNRTHGVTVILVTHEADIAAYAGRIITMRDGLVASDEINTQPARPTAAGEPARAPITPEPSTRGEAAPLALASMVMASAWQAVRRNGMRSALTMLGVLIGVAALMAMVAVGQGASQSVQKQIESLGTNLVVVLPGSSRTTGARSGLGSASTLTVDDANAVRREAPAVSDVAYLNRQSAQVQSGNRNWQTVVQGVTSKYPALTGWQVSVGRGLTDDDDRDGTSVALIGQTVFKQLFGPTENPVGAMILVKRAPMRVVGLLASKGQTAFGQDQDDIVMVPFTTAERKVLGSATPVPPAAAPTGSTQTTPTDLYAGATNPFGMQPRLTGLVNSIYLQAARPEDVTSAIDQATAILTRRHRILPDQDPDFSIRNLSQVAGVVESSSRVMTLLLAAVASISLVVGGIGIMNILLVSVTERTREIGLRMAIGARRLHVLLQFLDEAILLSVGGGLAGIAVGFTASRIISAVAGWPTVTPLWAVAGGFLFSAAVGIFFGYYPARKASRLNPMEALRYE